MSQPPPPSDGAGITPRWSAAHGDGGGPPQPAQPATRPRWLRVARVIYMVVLAALLLRVLLANRDQVADLLRVDRPWLLPAALATSAGQLALNASFWVRALRAMGRYVAWGTVLEITARSVPARYVPGSVWYAASRVAMLRSRGVGLGALAVTALLESVLTVLVSLALGGALLGAAGRLPGDEVTGVAWVLLLAAATTPPVLNRVLAWLVRRRGSGTAPRLRWRDYAALVGWMAAFWMLSALTFTLYLLAFGLELPGPVVVAGVFLLAWAIGFVTPIAPQGAGAFEVSFAALLAGTAAGPLVVVVAGFRALIGVRDALAFGWGAWRGRAGLDVSAAREPG